MKPKETETLYTRACNTKRITPQDDEGRAWHKALSMYEFRDAEKALDAWWSDKTPGSDGQPRGKWMPTPVELASATASVQRSRLAAAAERKDLVGYRCPRCKVTWCAYTNTVDAPECGRCRQPAEIVGRVAA